MIFGWAKPKPSERINQILSELIAAGPPTLAIGQVWIAECEAIKQFLDEDAEQRTEQRRPDAQV